MRGARAARDRRSRSRRRLPLAVVAVVAAGAAALLGTLPAAAAGSALAEPLDATWSTAQGTWAVVAMGHLDQPNNTFWQLWFRGSGSTRWTLVTPPGVATNGGLSADSGSTGAVTVGIEASQDLGYSPVARTSDGGKDWTPGVLPSRLLAMPDAVTTEADGSVVALVQRQGADAVVRAAASLTHWTTLTTSRSLGRSAAAKECGVDGLGAVAGGGSTLELAARCSTKGLVGIFSLQGTTWALTGPRLTGSLTGADATVLRLESGASGTAALVEATTGHTQVLLGMWRSSPSETWTVSAPLRLDAPVLATGLSASQAMTVVTGRPGHATGATVIAGPGEAWTALPAPPPTTAAVVDVAGSFDALAVSGSAFVDWHLGTTGKWQPGHRQVAPIVYGSST